MAAKKAVKKKRISKALLPSPDGLQEVWKQTEVQEAWSKLTDRYQIFILEYLANGRNARQAFNDRIDKMASNGVARSSGYRMLTNVHIGVLLDALRKGRKRNARELIERTLEEAVEEAYKPVFNKTQHKDKKGNVTESVDMTEIPDYPTRIKAAEALAKYEGFLNQDGLNINSNGTTNIQINLPGKRE